MFESFLLLLVGHVAPPSYRWVSGCGALALLLFMASLLRCLLHSNHSKTLLSAEEVAMSGASLKLQSHLHCKTDMTF